MIVEGEVVEEATSAESSGEPKEKKEE